VTALEDDVRTDPQETLLFLPHPYLEAAGTGEDYAEMYGWDTYYINLGLLAHGRTNILRGHILNQLTMIDRFGMVLNGNRTFYLTRSQPPLLADSLWRYFEATGDRDLLVRTYPSLIKEYREYWSADHHTTPVGLSTNRDLGDSTWRPELAAEAETGLDFCAIYGGDVRECVPLITNCTLVRHLEVLHLIAQEIDFLDEAQIWKDEHRVRAERIQKLCWNEERGLFLEYNYVREEQLPFLSVCTYWPLWAGIATDKQAARLHENLSLVEQAHGIAQTDQVYDVPHPEFENLQWSYPVGWPPMQIMVVEALLRNGFREAAGRVARKFVTLMLDEYARTGDLWEKYNVVDGNVTIPIERKGSVPFHGWTAAAAVILGRVIFESSIDHESDS